MTAATSNTSLFPGVEKTAHNWKPISTKGLFITSQVIASVVNLAQAHFVSGTKDLSQPLCNTLHSLLTTHREKRHLFHIVNREIPHTSKTVADMKVHAQKVVDAIPMEEQSELQQKISSLLTFNVIDKAPPFSDLDELAALLKTPDTEPVKKLLETFLQTTSHTSLQRTLVFLQSLDWDRAFNNFVTSGCSVYYSFVWSAYPPILTKVSSALHATTPEDFLCALTELGCDYFEFDINPALLFKEKMLDQLAQKPAPTTTDHA